MKNRKPLCWRRRGLCLVLICGALAVGCAPDDFDDFRDFDNVLTLRDVEYDFGENQTYAMPDEVVDIGEDLENVEERRTDLDDEILQQVASEMDALGYERLDDLDSPNLDVIVTVGAVAQEGTTWGSYYSYTDPWSGYYWYYPVTTVVINYPIGSILIHMADAEEVDTGLEEVAPVWVAGIRGIGGDRSEADVRTLISQAFTQSPYLSAAPSVEAFLGGEL